MLLVSTVSGVGIFKIVPNSIPSLPLLLIELVCCELLLPKTFLCLPFRVQCTRIPTKIINKRTGSITATAVSTATIVETGRDSKVEAGLEVAEGEVEGRLAVLSADVVSESGSVRLVCEDG